MTFEQLWKWTYEFRDKYKKGYKQTFLLASDVHFDNPYCNRDLFFKHLKQAKEKDAFVILNGDTLCLMQGKYDPRRSKANVRPEHSGANYIDLVIEDTAELLKPYANRILLIAQGNHCTSVTKRLETDVLTRLVERLNIISGTRIQAGKYQNFVRFVLEHKSGGRVRSKTLFLHHGAWGGVVTKGTLSASRYSALAPDADIVWSGHTHDHWQLAIPRYRLKQSGEVVNENQYHVKSGTYKEEFLKGEGWAVERIVTPKNLGAWWLTLEAFEEGISVNLQMAE